MNARRLTAGGLAADLAVLASSAWYYHHVYVVERLYRADVIAHAGYVQRAMDGVADFPAVTPTYYVLVAQVAQLFHMRALPASVPVLAFAIWAKFRMTRWFLERGTGPSWTSLGLALAALFVFPLPNPYGWPNLYLGQLAPSVWHNSTTVLTMPIVIGLFALHFDRREAGFKGWEVALAMALTALVVSIKPSYVFVLLPTLVALAPFEQGSWTRKLLWVLPAACALPAIGLGSWLLFGSGTDGDGTGATIELSPFTLWAHTLPTMGIPVSIGLGFLLSTAALRWVGRAHWALPTRAALLQAVLSLGPFVLFLETGARKWHGNFFWQVVPAFYMLNAVALREAFLRTDRKAPWWLRALLGVHVLSGIAYVVHCAFVTYK